MLLLLPLLIQCRKQLQHREFRQLGWQLFCSDNRHCLPWAMQNCYVSNRLPPSSTYHLTEDLPPKSACWNAVSFNFGNQGKAFRDSPTEISRSLASSIVQTEHTAPAHCTCERRRRMGRRIKIKTWQRCSTIGSTQEFS